MFKCLIILSITFTILVMPQISQAQAAGVRADIGVYIPSGDLAMDMIGVRLGFPLKGLFLLDNTVELAWFGGQVMGGTGWTPPGPQPYDEGSMLSLAYTCRTKRLPFTGLYAGGGAGIYDIHEKHGYAPETGWTDADEIKLGAHALVGLNPLWGFNAEARYTYIPGDIGRADLSGYSLSLGYRF